MSEAPPGTEIAAAAERDIAALPQPTSRRAAAETIRVCYAVLRAVWEPLEARLLQACWVIRKDSRDRDDFMAYIADELGDTQLTPEKAWLAAETWDAARKNRELRELAVDRPTEALDFVAELVGAGRQEELKDPKSDLARRSVEILSAPARRRQRMVTDLLNAEAAAKAQRHPDDVRTIESQEAELEELRRRIEPRKSAAATYREIRDELKDIGDKIDGHIETLADLPPPSDTLREDLEQATDRLDGLLMTLSEGLLEEIDP